MIRSYSIGRFLSPLLGFAALSGLCAGFVFGLLVTLFGLASGVLTVASGAGNTSKTVSQLVQVFPDFAFVVVASIAIGIISGFTTGIIAALTGGTVGFWWSFVCAVAISLLVTPYYYHGIELIPILVLSAFGALLPVQLISLPVFRHEWAQPARQWLRATWLVNPPHFARLSGVLLPILFYMAWQVVHIGPTFVENRNYAARIGNWATWQNSQRKVLSANAHRYSPRSSCQSNLKQIMLGLKQYTQDYDEFYPPVLTDPANGVMAAVQPYLKSTQIFQCPAEFYGYGEGKYESGDFTDYWFNARLYALSESKVTFSSNTIAWGEGNTGSGEANSAYSLSTLPANFLPAKRHLGGGNYAFADGHVKWLLPQVISNSAAPSGIGSTLVP